MPTVSSARDIWVGTDSGSFTGCGELGELGIWGTALGTRASPAMPGQAGQEAVAVCLPSCSHVSRWPGLTPQEPSPIYFPALSRESGTEQAQAFPSLGFGTFCR